MTVAPHPPEIRTLVYRTFRRLGAAVFSEDQIEETILIQAGRCMARSYRGDELFAMWMIDVGLLQFYDASGDILLVMNLLEEAQTRKMAA